MKRYVVLSVRSTWYSLNVDDYNDYIEDIDPLSTNTLISFQTADLIRHIKSGLTVKLLPSIIDLECFDKQMSQEGKEFRKSTAWTVINFLRYHKAIDSEFEIKESNFKELLEIIAALYLQLLTKDVEEETRFNTIERSINEVIYKRQFLGIEIDHEAAKSMCSKIEADIYKTKNTLQHKYNIFSPDLEKQQIVYLKSKNFNLIKSPLFTFKVHRNEDNVCSLFYEMLRNKKDLDSLLFMLSRWGSTNRTYPSFYGFGTITSRIILREPSLQNLRKSHRSIIIPFKGYKLLYIDYSQFEAGILASLSNDLLLIKLHQTDIYKDLAGQIFGDEEKRSDAKVVFYRYMYGDTSLSKEAKAYFKKFTQLNKFKEQIENQIASTGKIGTSIGNYRYKSELDAGWSLSHLIQATASLIYKNAVIKVATKTPLAKFLIPMHDGTVYQIPNSSYDSIKLKVIEIYKEEFKKICVNIEPSVTCSEFFY